MRCLSRRPEYLAPASRRRPRSSPGDVLHPRRSLPALEGVDTVYYLVHSMSSSRAVRRGRPRGSAAFGAAAREAGVRKIVYLGGLGRGDLSAHLASRQEVGEILRASGVPTIELRASIVIGSGSASFEMVRALVEKLPVMVTPRWVRVRAQPIAIEDVLAYLLAALDREPTGGELFEIGGADRVTYLDLMHEYARQRGLRRAMIPVPVLTPRLSSLWLGLVTPVYAGVGRKLVDWLRNETVVERRPARSTSSPCARGRRPRRSPARSPTRTARSRRRAGRTRRSRSSRPTAACAAGRGSSTRARSPWRRRRRRRLRADPADRRRDRLVQRRAALAAARAARRARGRAGAAARAARPGRPRGRATRSTSGASRRSSRTACCACSAEMKVPGRAWLQFEVVPDAAGSARSSADGHLRPVRAVRPRLLVRALAVSRLHLRRDAARSPRARAPRTVAPRKPADPVTVSARRRHTPYRRA